MPKPWWRETIETVLWAVVLALILRTFVVSGSMIPTLEIGDRVLVLKFWYHLPNNGPERGDIAVFKYPVDPRRDFVKRVIGLPGDTVEMRNGTVFVNGTEVFEPIISASATTGRTRRTGASGASCPRASCAARRYSDTGPSRA